MPANSVEVPAGAFNDVDIAAHRDAGCRRVAGHPSDLGDSRVANAYRRAGGCGWRTGPGWSWCRGANRTWRTSTRSEESGNVGYHRHEPGQRPRQLRSDSEWLPGDLRRNGGHHQHAESRTIAGRATHGGQPRSLLPAPYDFAITATSQGDSAIAAEETAEVTLDAYEDVAVHWLPAEQTITDTLTASFLLVITNTGNVETTFGLAVSGRFVTGATTAGVHPAAWRTAWPLC